MPGNRLYSLALLFAFFAVLALDIAIPAVTLSAMALIRWSILSMDPMVLKGGTA